MIQCRLCGVQGHEAKGVVLTRVNEKGVDGIWECRPICGAQMSSGDAFIAAVDGVFDTAPAPLAETEDERGEL